MTVTVLLLARMSLPRDRDRQPHSAEHVVSRKGMDALPQISSVHLRARHLLNKSSTKSNIILHVHCHNTTRQFVRGENDHHEQKRKRDIQD